MFAQHVHIDDLLFTKRKHFTHLTHLCTYRNNQINKTSAHIYQHTPILSYYLQTHTNNNVHTHTHAYSFYAVDIIVNFTFGKTTAAAIKCGLFAIILPTRCDISHGKKLLSK